MCFCQLVRAMKTGSPLCGSETRGPCQTSAGKLPGDQYRKKAAGFLPKLPSPRAPRKLELIPWSFNGSELRRPNRQKKDARKHAALKDTCENRTHGRQWNSRGFFARGGSPLPPPPPLARSRQSAVIAASWAARGAGRSDGGACAPKPQGSLALFHIRRAF